MKICDERHEDIGEVVKVKKEFFTIYPYSKFERGEVLKVAGVLRFVRFEGRRNPLWINVNLLEDGA